ncbi:MAG: hypothetical protein JW883_05280 [Deltaproteobacteria bacterium]|nr:hypothetical protein [Deltaproteobacteria bacterium]
MENASAVETETVATPDIVLQEDAPQNESGKSLFGEVAPTEAELTGLEPPQKEVKSSTETKDEKPPEGYVPHAALHEEHVKREELTEHVRVLQEKISKMEAEEQEPEEETFQILSDEEFDELAEEDPVEAVKYERALKKHLDEEKAKEAEGQARQRRLQQDTKIVTQSFERMEKAVPGIHEEGNTVNQELSQFAIDNGFEPDFLQAMTAPGTLILPPGAKRAVLLGDGAAGLVEMIAKFHKATKGQNTKVSTRSAETSEKGGSIATGSEIEYGKMSQAEKDRFLGKEG